MNNNKKSVSKKSGQAQFHREFSKVSQSSQKFRLFLLNMLSLYEKTVLKTKEQTVFRQNQPNAPNRIEEKLTQRLVAAPPASGRNGF